MRKEQAIRDALGDFLGMLEHKVRNGDVSVGDIGAIMRVIESSGGVRATVRELADYYGQSEDNVRHVIHRNIMPPPTRRVYYDFGAFRERIPSGWTKKRWE